MPISQFIDGNAFVQSVTSGQRNTAALAQLQRSLRDADRQFAFDVQADPFKLAELAPKLSLLEDQAEVSRNTLREQEDAIRANSRILGVRASISERTEDLLVRDTELTVFDNTTAAAVNRANGLSRITDLAQQPELRAAAQANNVAANEVQGIPTPGVVDFTANNGPHLQGIQQALGILGEEASSILPGVDPAKAASTGQAVIEDLRGGGPISRRLQAAKIQPEAVEAIAQAIEVGGATSKAAASKLTETRESEEKKNQEIKKLQNEKLDLQRLLAEAKANPNVQAAGDATPQTVPGPDGTPLPVQSITAAPPVRASRTPINVPVSQEQQPLTPQNVFEQLQLMSMSENDIFSVSRLPILNFGGGQVNFQNEGEANQIGVSTGTTPGAVDLPIIDPRGDTSELFRALIAQESNGNQFNSRGGTLVSKPHPGGGSGGAVGIAQIIPDTARGIAKKHGIRFDNNRYRNDAEYNFNLGRLHFDDLLKQFKSVPLALAGYNAGAGLVKHAIKRLGDPRRGDISEADFIARLPSVMKNGQTQTRDYVQKILKNYAAARRKRRAPAEYAGTGGFTKGNS